MSLPQEELPILEAVINIRNRLTALKKNRAEFIKAQDVANLYQATVKQVTRLNDARDEQAPQTPNRLDTILSDVFTLLSLFFLTIGKTREAPATYVQIASMRQLLDHMNESALYSEADLKPFLARFQELKDIVKHDAAHGGHPDAMTKLLERKLNEVETLLESLQQSLAEVSVELVPVYQKLLGLRRLLLAQAAKDKPSKAEVNRLLEDLRKIDAKRVDGKFLGPGGSFVPTSQALCSSLLEECFDISHEIRATEESHNVSPSLQPIYDRLQEIRAKLEKLALTRRWTLRETDLWNYFVSLEEIDKMRVEGKWTQDEVDRPAGQYVLLYLLRRCYGLIYRLLSSSEPVSEELMPIANKLSTVKKCLNEVLKYGGPFSPRDLYPYQLALHQIDSMRKDGKFVSEDGSIPEGQGIVMAHLNECHELLEILKESMEQDQDDDDDEDDDEGTGEDLEDENQAGSE